MLICLYSVIGVLYFFFGMRIYTQTTKMLRSFSVENNVGLLAKIKRSQKILTYATVFSVGTFICFMLRAGFMSYQAIKTIDLSTCFWWIDLPYYFILEIVPLFLVFVVFKYLPSRNKRQSTGELVAGY